MEGNAPAPGRPFGGAFTLLRPLGAGGAASVWLAREDALGREVALKVPASADPAARGRFLDEARALAAVRHPGVAPVLRYGTDPATSLPFFAMPVFPRTLADRLDGGARLPEAEAAELGLALVPAIAALHGAGIAHRDIKPSNVLLDAAGAPVLADPCTAPRGGTPAWAAPEQLAEASEKPSLVTRHSSLVPVGAAADWHALGLLLYRALAGALPPPRGILPADVEPPRGSLPRDLRPRPSRAWEPLLRALLEPDPAARPADPDAILRALRRLRRRARARGFLRRVRRPVALALAALAAAALLAALAVRAPTGRANGGAAAEAPPPDPAKAWTRTCADHLRETLAAAIAAPTPDARNRIVVPAGALLLSGDLPPGADPPAVVLDGGTLLFSVGAAALRDTIDRCEAFLSAAPDGATMSLDVLPSRKEWLPNPILVTERGGRLDTVDGDITAYVTNAVRRAPGVDAATLHVFGLSSIVLERRLLDPGLTVSGSGQVAEFLPNGRFRNRRWFDDDDPL